MEVWDVLVECFQKLENCQAYVIDNERLYSTIGQMVEEIKEKLDYFIETNSTKIINKDYPKGAPLWKS